MRKPLDTLKADIEKVNARTKAEVAKDADKLPAHLQACARLDLQGARVVDAYCTYSR